MSTAGYDVNMSASDAKNLQRRTKLLTHVAVDDELFILDVGGQVVHQLNHTAAFIWQQIDGQRSTDRIAIVVAEHYGVELETAVQAVSDTIIELVKVNAIEQEL